MTAHQLGDEKAMFIGGFWVALAGQVYLALYGSRGELAALILLALLAYAYLTFRFATFLKQPAGLAATYTVLAPFALLGIIPYIGLLASAKTAARELQNPV